MEQERINQLIQKYSEGRATVAEREELTSWYREIAYQDAEFPGEEASMGARMFARLNQSIKTTSRKTGSYKKWAAAAAILLVVGSGIFFYTSSRHLEGSAATRDLLANDIKPGSNKAYLTLANGKRLSLTDAANGAIAKEAGVEISKTADGRVVYSSLPSGISPRGGERGVALNTIETPKGGQYQVRLPDGTKVWLNAASKLIYPVTFNGREERRVELSGEAYFEVAKDKAHPFKVKSNDQEVQVLGTHFNINSYTDEVSTKTTLLEGSVKVASRPLHPASLSLQGRDGKAGEGGGTILTPGQQSINDGKIIKVIQVDTELAIAWKNNKFIFEKDNIQYIMRMIERWYNVEVIYTGPLPTGEFGGSMSKYENVDEVLKPLESTGKVKFRIEGRKIIVSR